MQNTPKLLKSKLSSLLGLVPAAVVAACVCVSLSGYVKPTLGSIETESSSEGDISSSSSDVSDAADLTESSQDPRSDGSESAKKSDSKSDKTEKGGKTTSAPVIQTVSESGMYADGTYIGTGSGFAGAIKVQVTISGGRIADITVLETSDGSEYMSKAQSLISKMISGQTTNVDAVSGATYSSGGIVEAVRNALSKAQKTGSGQNSSNSSATKTDSSKNSSSDSENNKNTTPKPDKSKKGKFPYKDGVYLGTGEGYKGDITVAVSIKDKTIDAILVIDTSDDDQFFSRAKALINNVIKEQSVKVDAVSGATFSSEGIKDAIKDALKAADKATNGEKENDKDSSKKDDTQSKSDSSSKPDSSDSKSDTDSPDSSGADTSSSSDSSAPSDGEDKTYKYKDGTYSAVAICSPGRFKEFREYTVSVTVTIKDDKIVDITDVKGVGDYDDSNDFYLKRAVKGTSKYKGVVAQLLEKASADAANEDIDAVSGATCSSEAIIKAVREALLSALDLQTEDR